MDRKEFIQKAVGAMVVTLPMYGLVSCSSSDDGGGNQDPTPGGEANCSENGTKSAIGTNHGHTLTVSKSDVTSAVEKTYSIQGSSGHDHLVTISASNFADLKNNKAISVTSTSGDGHTHSVNVSCA